MTAAMRTRLAFQHDSKLYSLTASVTSVRPFMSLEEPNRQLFKTGTEQSHVVVTDQTIFHPQGGGQPSDVGRIKSKSGKSFEVATARMDATNGGQVLHFGSFGGGQVFDEGEAVDQVIDVEKRLLFSRLHTAGHVLGSAVRHLLEKEVDGFDELKASHFPDSAACEFQGLIEGKWKDHIQGKVDEFIAAKMPVKVDWWSASDFRDNDLERLLPDSSTVAPGEKFRVVHIVGAEVYPCGGTHVETTDLCGETKVKKISRSKGVSRVSYTVL